jgi:putative transposase
MPRLRHYDHLGSARFVTFSCYHRYRLLRHPETIRTFLAGLRNMREGGIKILGYVIMPEHVHLVVVPPDGLRLGIEIGRLKSLTARDMLPQLIARYGQKTDRLYVSRNGERRRAFWQSRCYDHNCRTPETTREKINYCHNNPVKRGLVKSPGAGRGPVIGGMKAWLV